MEAITPHLTVDVVRDGQASGGAYAVLDIRAPQGFAVPHNVNRRSAGVLHVLEGEVTVCVDSLPFLLGPGGHAEVGRGVPWRAEVTADARLLWVGTPAGIETLTGVLGQPPLDDDDAAALIAAAGINRVHATW